MYNLIGILLDILEKTIHGLAYHLDLKQFGIRDELTPQEKLKKLYLFHTTYNLTKEEKYIIYGCLSSNKISNGYHYNI